MMSPDQPRYVATSERDAALNVLTPLAGLLLFRAIRDKPTGDPLLECRGLLTAEHENIAAVVSDIQQATAVASDVITATWDEVSSGWSASEPGSGWTTPLLLALFTRYRCDLDSPQPDTLLHYGVASQLAELIAGTMPALASHAPAEQPERLLSAHRAWHGAAVLAGASSPDLAVRQAYVAYTVERLPNLLSTKFAHPALNKRNLRTTVDHFDTVLNVWT